MKKSSIQRFAIWARTELIDRVSQRAYQYDITKDGYGNANAETVSGRPLTPGGSWWSKFAKRAIPR